MSSHSQNKHFPFSAQSSCVAQVSAHVFVHASVRIGQLNWIYKALPKQTPPPQRLRARTRFPLTAHLQPSSSPQAIIIPAIRYFLTMTTSSLAALPSTLGFGKRGWRPSFPRITITEKADSSLMCCLRLFVAPKCITGPGRRGLK